MWAEHRLASSNGITLVGASNTISERTEEGGVEGVSKEMVEVPHESSEANSDMSRWVPVGGDNAFVSTRSRGRKREG
jgi:hypothetical protein